MWFCKPKPVSIYLQTFDFARFFHDRSYFFDPVRHIRHVKYVVLAQHADLQRDGLGVFGGVISKSGASGVGQEAALQASSRK